MKGELFAKKSQHSRTDSNDSVRRIIQKLLDMMNEYKQTHRIPNY